MNREQAKKQRSLNPEKRDEYLRDLRESSGQISEYLRKGELKCNCDERNKDREEYSPCMYCSLGQQSADLMDEGIGMEGIDF